MLVANECDCLLKEDLEDAYPTQEPMISSPAYGRPYGYWTRLNIHTPITWISYLTYCQISLIVIGLGLGRDAHRIDKLTQGFEDFPRIVCRYEFVIVNVITMNCSIILPLGCSIIKRARVLCTCVTE